MIIDSSAAIAILQEEPEARTYAKLMASVPLRRMGAPGYLETCMVFIARRGPGAVAAVDAFIRNADIALVDFTSPTARVAVEAFLKYGKGRHKAALNFGDCISYAVAKTEAMPLLFKGDDFRLTDIEAVI